MLIQFKEINVSITYVNMMRRNDEAKTVSSSSATNFEHKNERKVQLEYEHKCQVDLSVTVTITLTLSNILVSAILYFLKFKSENKTIQFKFWMFAIKQRNTLFTK